MNRTITTLILVITIACSLTPVVFAQTLQNSDLYSQDLQSISPVSSPSPQNAVNNSPAPVQQTTAPASPAPAQATTPTQTSAPINLLSTTPNTPATNPTPSNTTNSNSTGLAICTGAKDASNPNDNRPICDFNQFLLEGRKIINWLFVIAIPIVIVLFAYGGVLYIIGTPGNRKKANEIFTAAGIGFGIMLIAWVSVYTIVSWLTTGTNGGSTNPTGITTFLGQ